MKQLLIRVFLPVNSEFHLTPDNLLQYFSNNESIYSVYGDGKNHCLNKMEENQVYDVYHFGLEFETDVNAQNFQEALENGALKYMWAINQYYDQSVLWSDGLFEIIEDCDSNNYFYRRIDNLPFELQEEDEKFIKRFLFSYFFHKYGRENEDYSFSYDVSFDAKESLGAPITIIVNVQPHQIPKIDFNQKRSRKCHKKK
ncbi:MAG: hypothetical protein K2M17_00100 [Bacilli bacterium]|nr:hypothetical protein [Bacilli bacterium]